MSIPLAELARQEDSPGRATWFRWAKTGVIQVERRGQLQVPAGELPLARLAARLSRAGVQGPAIAALLCALRECPVDERRSRFAESILLRLSEGTWAFLPTLSALPQPGQVLGALLVGEMI